MRLVSTSIACADPCNGDVVLESFGKLKIFEPTKPYINEQYIHIPLYNKYVIVIL